MNTRAGASLLYKRPIRNDSKGHHRRDVHVRVYRDAVHRCKMILRGSYAVVVMIDGILYGFRDPLGIKPMCIGKTENGIILASESVAIDALGGTLVRDVVPGELICIDENGMRCMQIAVANHRAHCIFEYIYFARADAVLDGALVYDVRRNIGGMLHEEDPVDADLVCPVPDSGTAYAIGHSQRSGIPFVESLMKNRYMGGHLSCQPRRSGKRRYVLN